MAPQNIDTVTAGNNIAAVPAAQSQTPATAPNERLAAQNSALQKNQGQADRVQVSPEALHRAAMERQAQQPAASKATGTKPATTTTGRAETQAAGTVPQGNTLPPPPAETRQEKMAVQTEQRIENKQTVRNYTNATLYTQINGRQIDEKV